MLCIRGTSHRPVSVCVCLSEVGVLLKRLNVGSQKQHLSLVVSESSLSGRGQGHASNFYIVDFKKFRHSKSSVYR